MELEYYEGTLFVRIKGNLNRKNNYKIYNYVDKVIKKHQIKKVIYNLKKLQSIDESSIDAILKTKCTIQNNNGIVYLCEVTKPIRNKLQRLHIKFIDNEKTAFKMI